MPRIKMYLPWTILCTTQWRNHSYLLAALHTVSFTAHEGVNFMWWLSFFKSFFYAIGFYSRGKAAGRDATRGVRGLQTVQGAAFREVQLGSKKGRGVSRPSPPLPPAVTSQA